MTARLANALRRWPGVIACLTLLLSGTAGHADVRVSGLFSDHMVVQRDAPVPVWGWADAGETVNVTFRGKNATVAAGPDGRWMVRLPALKASASPAELVISGRNIITLKDVLVGDVWLGSGQSNMEWPIREIANAPEEMASAGKPLVRLFTVPRSEKAQVVEDLPSKWAVCSPETVRDFSAVLYLFGREIHAETGVPIGLIHSSVGGTRIELWTAPEGLATVPEFADGVARINDAERAYREMLPGRLTEVDAWMVKARDALASGARVPVAPDWPQHPNPGVASLYHGMIYPLVPFGLRGVVWYQGEWNGGENEVYVKRMQALIAGWRKVWGLPDLPFHYVQLARMPQPDCEPWSGDGLAPTREAQRRSLAIPHTGMACIIDLDGNSDWHPRNKQDVGKRLSLWALRNEYGRKNLVVSGPLYRDTVVEGPKVRIRFDHTGSGLAVGTKRGLEPWQLTPGAPLANFAVAGADRRWVRADAVIDGRDVVVSSPDVAVPVAVRYAYCNDPKGCNLYNREGLPASPFRTDDW